MMAQSIPRPRVFLDIQSGSDFFGRIVIELFHDKVPKTCKNFVALCTSSFTPSSATKPLTYKLSPFHRVIDEFMIQGGDITAGDGTGGTSIHGGNFEDENIGWREIDKEGLVCMANRGKDTNSSQFFITLAQCPHLNTKHTVFGHVVSGKEVLDRMAKVPVDAKDRPVSEILISHCGELERRIKNTVPIIAASSSNHPLDHRRPSPDNRGRQRPKHPRTTASSPDSRSSFSTSSYRGNGKNHKKPTPPRRRSDFTIDETRRGRSLTRSVSPEHPSKAPSPPPHHHHHHHHHHRKRSPPPSRSRSPRMNSQSPHLRRRHTRSRSRSRSPRARGWRNDRRENGGHRWWDEETLRREEEEREGGRQRWEGIIEDGPAYDHHNNNNNRSYGGRTQGHGNYDGGGRDRDRERNRRFAGGMPSVAVGGGGLGGGGGAAGGGPGGQEVRFKGRGSMKYRERKW